MVRSWSCDKLSFLEREGFSCVGVELQTERGEVCVNGSAPISGDDFKEVFVTSLGEVRMCSHQCFFALEPLFPLSKNA